MDTMRVEKKKSDSTIFIKPLFLARLNIVFVLFVIVWGAWVRLSGSGAGCGEHWPLCNGSVIPLEPSMKTLIELTHRLTSGIFGILIFFLFWFSFRQTKSKHPLRKWSAIALILTIIEALIGAVLVKKGLVVDDQSVMRVVVIGLHLVNTLLLVGSIVCCEYFARNLNEFNSKASNISLRQKLTFLLLGLLFLFVGGTGAIAALGNMLFPDYSLASGIQKDFSNSSHFLIKLRIFHPISAVLLVLGLIQISLTELAGVKRLFPKKVELLGGLSRLLVARYLFFGSIVALLFGAINWLLMAPIWGAMTHLVIADLLWMCFVYLVCLKLSPLNKKAQS